MTSPDYLPLALGLPAVYRDDQESFAQLESFLGIVDDLDLAQLQRVDDLPAWLSPAAPSSWPPALDLDAGADAVARAYAQALDAAASWFAFAFPRSWPASAALLARRASVLESLARLWRERATAAGFVDFVALYFGLEGDTRPILLEHFTVAPRPDETVVTPLPDPGLRATLFVPSAPFARHELRREVVAFVDRYSPTHVLVRVCWVGPAFRDGILQPPVAGATPAQLVDYRERARAVLRTLVSRVEHGLGIRVWECIDAGSIDDRLGTGLLPTEETP